MERRDRDEPTPGRMKDGPWEEFTDVQPNRSDETSAATRRHDGERGSGADAPPQRIDHDDPVEEASDESFPASDPPSFTPGHSG